MEANEYVGLDEDWVDGYPERSALIRSVKYIQIFTLSEMSNQEARAIWDKLYKIIEQWAEESGNEPCQRVSGEVRRGFGIFNEHIGMTIQEYPEPWNHYTDGWDAHGPVDLINKLILEEYEPLVKLADAVKKELIWACVAVWCAEHTDFDSFNDSYSEREVHAAFVEWSISEILTRQKKLQETIGEAQDWSQFALDGIVKIRKAECEKRKKENKKKTLKAREQRELNSINLENAITEAAIKIWPQMGVDAPLRSKKKEDVAGAIVQLAKNESWKIPPKYSTVVKQLKGRKNMIFLAHEANLKYK